MKRFAIIGLGAITEEMLRSMEERGETASLAGVLVRPQRLPEAQRKAAGRFDVVDNVRSLLVRALSDPRGLQGVTADDDALDWIAEKTGGDARVAYNALESAASEPIGGAGMILTATTISPGASARHTSPKAPLAGRPPPCPPRQRGFTSSGGSRKAGRSPSSDLDSQG